MLAQNKAQHIKKWAPHLTFPSFPEVLLYARASVGTSSDCAVLKCSKARNTYPCRSMSTDSFLPTYAPCTALPQHSEAHIEAHENSCSGTHSQYVNIHCHVNIQYVPDAAPTHRLTIEAQSETLSGSISLKTHTIIPPCR